MEQTSRRQILFERWVSALPSRCTDQAVTSQTKITTMECRRQENWRGHYLSPRRIEPASKFTVTFHIYAHESLLQTGDACVPPLNCVKYVAINTEPFHKPWLLMKQTSPYTGTNRCWRITFAHYNNMSPTAHRCIYIIFHCVWFNRQYSYSGQLLSQGSTGIRLLIILHTWGCILTA